ncbi:hypothetical protein HDU87_007389 [Geranomyces variabilis]|uniref:Enoyl reductase (ER) domain-containing protein n=1 Tax=Geranomyces variabilis TaxID=109894 RepID=A0AAD5TS92_9FUNG|nr:hypothetical protein HDU87_007389 [Geranomyces variabilis]
MSRLSQTSRVVKAAVVHKFGDSPVYEDWSVSSSPPSPDHVTVKVRAAGLSQLCRARASGAHYSAKGMSLPLVPGVDGVGSTNDGQLVYFTSFDRAASSGSFAEVLHVLRKNVVPLPAGSADPAQVAALVNATMASWVAFSRSRRDIPRVGSLGSGKPFTVFILGVTGVSGQLGVQVARLLGADRVIGAGRNRAVLDHLVAANHDSALSAAVELTNDTDKVASEIASAAGKADIVLDFLWGEPASMAMAAIAKAPGRDDTQLLEWIQIGNMAGPDIKMPASLLRSRNFYMCGSGIGPQTDEELLRLIEEFLPHLASGRLSLPVTRVPLKDVESTWQAPSANGDRIVFTI